VEGYRAWQLAADGEPPEQEPRSVRLLAQYDCYMIGSRPRERLVPEVAKGPIAAHPRGRFEGASAVSVLLVDGVVAGMWERKRRGPRVELRVELFVRLTAAQRRAVEAEAARVGAFLDAEISLSISADRL